VPTPYHFNEQVKYGAHLRLSKIALLRAIHGMIVCADAASVFFEAEPEILRVNRAVRACLKILKGAAVRDFGRGQGGEAGASPQRAVRAEPTQATGKRPAARRVFAEKTLWLRCSSVEDPQGIFSFVASRQTAFSAKTAPFIIFRQALSDNSSPDRIAITSRSKCDIQS
jgi:hypothetical protein